MTSYSKVALKVASHYEAVSSGDALSCRHKENSFPLVCLPWTLAASDTCSESGRSIYRRGIQSDVQLHPSVEP